MNIPPTKRGEVQFHLPPFLVGGSGVGGGGGGAPGGGGKAREFDPFGHAGLTPSGIIRLTPSGKIKMTPVDDTAGEFL